MRNQYDIVILALNRSDDILNSSTWQLAISMARTKRILYVNHPKTWWDCLKQGKWIKSKKAKQSNNLHCLEPFPTLPINFLPKGWLYNWLQNINHSWLQRSISRVIRNSPIELFINAFDFYFPHLHRRLGAQVSRFAYYSLDPIVKKRSMRHGIEHEEALVADADHVFCSAKGLYDQWSKHHHSVHYLPNAVNFTSLQQQIPHPPRTISLIRGLKVGLFGNIDRRIDLDLLEATLRAQYISLILAGPLDHKSERLLQLPNVYYYGTYNYEDLRSYAESVDVCLIPYKVTPDMEKVYPLKMMEYFAFGKPVVMTPFNSEQVRELKDQVYVADTSTGMQEAILKAYHENTPHLQNERKRIASENNWDSRSRTLFEVVYHDQSA